MLILRQILADSAFGIWEFLSPDVVRSICNLVTFFSRPSCFSMLKWPFLFEFFFLWASRFMGAQWLSGRVLDSRPKGRGFEPHRRHCVVVLEQDTFILA